MLPVGGLRCGVVPRGDFRASTNALTLVAGRNRALSRARPRANVAAVPAGRYPLELSVSNQRNGFARRWRGLHRGCWGWCKFAGSPGGCCRVPSRWPLHLINNHRRNPSVTAQRPPLLHHVPKRTNPARRWRLPVCPPCRAHRPRCAIPPGLLPPPDAQPTVGGGVPDAPSVG